MKKNSYFETIEIPLILQKDREFFLDAIKQNGWLLRYASYEL